MSRLQISHADELRAKTDVPKPRPSERDQLELGTRVAVGLAREAPSWNRIHRINAIRRRCLLRGVTT